VQQTQNVQSKLKAYKQKYYLGLLLKGIITTLILLSSIVIFSSVLEYTLWMNSWLRGILLFSIIAILFYIGYKNIILPLIFITNVARGISDDDAAKQLGKLFPSISDQLLNFIQLQRIEGNNDLVQASLQQRNISFENFDFSSSINLKYSVTSGKYLLLLVAIILFIYLWNPNVLISGSERIINFQESYAPVAPFDFTVQNEKLLAFENEDFLLQIKLTGNSFPKDLYLIDGTRKIKMRASGNQLYEYNFEKIKVKKDFYLEAAGFRSKQYKLIIVSRPSLINFDVRLNFPAYIKRKQETLSNTGNLRVPEGTKATWQLLTDNTQRVDFIFENNVLPENIKLIDNQYVTYNKTLLDNSIYSIRLHNDFGSNIEGLKYTIDVIADEQPTINLNAFQDTTLYSFISLGGNIADDYGLTKLKLYYTIDSNHEYQSISIPIDLDQSQQSYFYQWSFDSTLMANGKTLKYYLQIWDNDKLHGNKSTKTGVYTLKIPSKKQVKQKMKEASQKAEKNINKTLEEAQDLKKKLEDAEERLKGKKELTWQDESLLKDIIKKKEALNKALEKLREENKLNTLQQKRFTEQNKKLAEKAEQLQQLMDELLDEETKQLYEELQKLLEEQQDVDQIQNLMEQINNKENNLEKELERTLELFKKMKFDYEINEKINELNQLKKNQEKLKEDTGNKETNNDELLNQQEQIEENFNEIKEDLKELEKLGEELKNPENLPDQEKLFDEIQEAFNEAKENIEKQKSKQAKKAQEEISKKMNDTAKELEQMMAGMEMMQQQENLDNLRDIVHNLLKLSFDQEEIMNAFREVDQSDPRFVELSQQQINLKGNSEIIKDSLESLSNRVFQIKSFVTRELNDMNSHMDASAYAIKERKKNDAVSKQQFAMTSMNNLALLLDDVLEQMQQQMSDGMGKPSPGQKKNETPGLSELQQQLNKKIEDLKKSGKSGRQLSEDLAQMAAEQERIRKALEDAQEKFNENNGGEMPGNGISEKMEETEIDLVNKEITNETIKRQREILSRLLEAEGALREKELDQEREAESAKEIDNIVPKAFEEYFKMKEMEIELLKTIPPKLYPYYKNEVNDYFKRIGNTQ